MQDQSTQEFRVRVGSHPAPIPDQPDWASGTRAMDTPHPPPDAHATLVVVGPDESEQHYAFDALIDDTDGMLVRRL